MHLAGPYMNFQCVIDEKPWGKVIPVYVHLVLPSSIFQKLQIFPFYQLSAS
jgi:hypothetical protein